MINSILYDFVMNTQPHTHTHTNRIHNDHIISVFIALFYLRQHSANIQFNRLLFNMVDFIVPLVALKTYNTKQRGGGGAKEKKKFSIETYSMCVLCSLNLAKGRVEFAL